MQKSTCVTHVYLPLRCLDVLGSRSIDIISFICLWLFHIILQALITYCFSCLKLNLITHVYLLFKEYHASKSDDVFCFSVCLFIQELQLAIIYYWVIYIIDTHNISSNFVSFFSPASNTVSNKASAQFTD